MLDRVMYLSAAAFSLERAHRALGELYAASSTEELSQSVHELVTAGRDVLSWLAQAGRATAALGSWLDGASADAARHPLSVQDDLIVARSAGDYYLDVDAHRPAAAVCAEYIDAITALFDLAKHEAKRLGVT